jgi:thiamine biosynthesis protein ThiS
MIQIEEVGIKVNGEPRSIAKGLTIEALLRDLALEPRMIVVEHNGAIIRRERYDRTMVNGGDSLELVHFVGGG